MAPVKGPFSSVMMVVVVVMMVVVATSLRGRNWHSKGDGSQSS
jgi:hypothetical protein